MFYEFRQNNSYGKYYRNTTIDVHVFIESTTKRKAIEIAESKGVYFDGVRKGIDCPCCGDRWTRPYEGKKALSYCGRELQLKDKQEETNAIVYFLDGTVKYANCCLCL